MKYNDQTEWSTNYAARFKPLAKAQAAAIESVLYKNIKATVNEINAAMARICETWSDERNAPGINAIAYEIRLARYGDSANVPNHVRAYRGGESIETTMVELKAWLKCCNDPVQAWNLICLPLDLRQKQELHAYAEKHGVKYERFVPVNRGGMKKLIEHMESPEKRSIAV